MPSPNKYHSSGFLYGTMGYERGESVRGYIWMGSTPRNFGHNADKRVRREQSKYWRSLHGRASITKGTATGRTSGSSQPELQSI